MTRVGVISDTHGLVRSSALDALQGVDLVLHAGDIGSPEVVERLEEIAPVIAIRGNVDRGDWADKFPETRLVEFGGRRIYLLHSLRDLELDPRVESIDVVISGHSHKPAIEQTAGILYLNPGSAGPRRFKLPVSLALLELDGKGVRAEIHELAV